MKNCPVCQHALNDDALECTHCGFSFAPILGMSVDTANARLAEQRRAYQEKQATQSRAAAEPAHATGEETAQNSAKTNRNAYIIGSLLVIIIALLGYFVLDAKDKRIAELTDQLHQHHPKSYRDNQDGTVTDLHTGLQWKRCSEGQSWNGSTCSGEEKEYTWKEAMNLRSEFAGYSDWRLPTIAELNTLVYCSNGEQRLESYTDCSSDSRGEYQRPTIDTQAFPNTPHGGFWTSSPFAANPDGAWVVYFNNGDVDWSGKGAPYSVRLVRGQ